jgi:hypothetical protein
MRLSASAPARCFKLARRSKSVCWRRSLPSRWSRSSAALSLAAPANAGNGSAVGAGTIGIWRWSGWQRSHTTNGVCCSATARLLRPTSSCLCSASASVRSASVSGAGVRWPSAPSRPSPLTAFPAIAPLGASLFGPRVLHCTVMPKTRWGRLRGRGFSFTAWRSPSTCPRLEASVQLAASPGLLLCWVDYSEPSDS